MMDYISLLGFVFGVYIVAGTIKGLLGLGLPTTALTLMTFVLSPLQVLAINLAPMFFTNLWQFSRSKNHFQIIKTYRYFAISLSLCILVGSFFTIHLPSSALQMAVAAAVILFSLYNLFQRELHLSADRDAFWQIIFGIAAGIMGAFTSMWAVPLVVYLLTRNLTPRDFVDAAGFLLLVGCLPLSIGYISTGLVRADVIGPAIVAIAGALIGFQMGAFLRAKIDGTRFRRILLWFFFVMGIRMIVVAYASL